MPSIVNEMVDRIVCINLDRRPDRWTACARRFGELGIEATRFPAREGPPDLPDDEDPYLGSRRARVGCAMSHLAAIAQARIDGVSSILVFEDDVVFQPGFEQTLRSWVPYLPSDWDVLYLGGYHPWHPAHRRADLWSCRLPPLPVRGPVYRLRFEHCLHAYAVRQSAFEGILALDPRREAPIDNQFVAEVLPRYNCYGLMTPEETRPGTWGLVRQDLALGSDLRPERHLHHIGWNRGEPAGP